MCQFLNLIFCNKSLINVSGEFSSRNVGESTIFQFIIEPIIPQYEDLVNLCSSRACSSYLTITAKSAAQKSRKIRTRGQKMRTF